MAKHKPAAALPKVIKRDGKTIQEWDSNKLGRAIKASFVDIRREPNGELAKLVSEIESEAMANSGDGFLSVVKVQQLVKTTLMRHDPEVAESYIVFASKRDEARTNRLNFDSSAVGDFVHITRYARYMPSLQRRELFEESVGRVEKMFTDLYPSHTDGITTAFNSVRAKEVLPSMRNMQFAGDAVLKHHAKNYNCAFSVCNRVEFFKQLFYLLLCGTGTGYSVQFRHVDQIPALGFVDKSNVKHHVVVDTIEGWADALDALIQSYYTGEYVEFAYHEIRAKGVPLKVSGGTAPGHIPLKKSLTAIRSILDGAQGRQLRPIECHDIICHSADSVYAGGIREAALIALFSIDDGEMMICKTGNWWSTNPQRARANNSVVLLRSNASKEQFLRITKSTRQYGEPGFFFTDDLDYGGNPCMEISLNPRLKITPSTRAEIARWAKASGKVAPKVEVGEVKWGWSFCNLTTVNVAVMQNAGHFLEAVRQASVIGTLQASLTSFPYLGWITEFIVWREALLGVSMTGILDNPSIGLNADLLKQGSQAVVDTNIEWAEKIGINSAARTTCVKPEGSASKVLGVVGHGIHAHHARRYFLRVRCKPNDPAYLYFRSVNPHMCTRESDVKEFITFPVTAPDAAVIRSDLTEEQFLDNVFLVQKNWVAPGTARPDSSPGACNNVSNTCNVRDGMWDHVSNAIWKNRAIMTGISLMPWYGDKEFQNAPQEEVINEADEAKWNHIVSHYKKVEWSAFIERTDNTTLMTESGCAGGACLL